eukprot:scaffold4120_cov57-Phaeocystis_antarctica.AAC.5
MWSRKATVSCVDCGRAPSCLANSVSRALSSFAGSSVVGAGRKLSRAPGRKATAPPLSAAAAPWCRSAWTSSCSRSSCREAPWLGLGLGLGSVVRVRVRGRVGVRVRVVHEDRRRLTRPAAPCLTHERRGDVRRQLRFDWLTTQPVRSVAQDVEALGGGRGGAATVARREVAVDHRPDRVGQVEQRAVLAAHVLRRLLQPLEQQVQVARKLLV